MRTIATTCFTICMLTLFQPLLAKDSPYPMEKSSATVLRADLPFYVFEYDLERLYPATWEFYKKLDDVNRDKIYAAYLFDADIKHIRREVFQVALGEKRGKSTPAPFSLNQALASLTSNTSATAAGLSLHGIVNGPTVSAVHLNADSHQSIYSFLKNH